MKNDQPRTDPLKRNPNAFADAALDGDISLDELFASPEGVRSAAAHVRVIRRLERLLRIESNAGRAPDFTAAVLAEVGVRRGWMDGPSRRLVWGGRLIAAATLLIALGVTLSVRRAVPELAGTNPETAAFASMVEEGERVAADAGVPLVGVVEVLGTRRPVLAQLTAVLEDVPAEHSNGLSLSRCSSEPRAQSSGRAIVVRVSLDPASQRTVDAVAGLGGSPKWLRSACRTGLDNDQN